MKNNKWFYIGLGLGVAAAGVLLLKKTGLLRLVFGRCECEEDDEDFDNFDTDCVIETLEEASPVVSAETQEEDTCCKHNSEAHAESMDSEAPVTPTAGNEDLQ